MQTVWFILVAFMLTAYVILDGFDIGAGILHLVVARSEEERRLVLRAIGPVWDGNEVWLIAAGGTLYFAFPVLYASSFSGFYLPLNMVLWLLILRAIGIEFRAHVASVVWRALFDGAFSISSILLAVFFGAALGNVIRGVPLSDQGYFFEALWTNWRVGPKPGILDWYTVLCGVLALITLAVHGGHYVALKTTGALNERAGRIAVRLWLPLVVLTAASLAATLSIRHGLLTNFLNHPILFIVPASVVFALGWMAIARKRANHQHAFWASCLYVAAILVGAAVALYPNVLPASTDPTYSLTIYNTSIGEYSLRLGLVWWTFGMLVAIGYFVFVYRMFRGKVSLEGDEHWY